MGRLDACFHVAVRLFNAHHEVHEDCQGSGPLEVEVRVAVDGRRVPSHHAHEFVEAPAIRSVELGAEARVAALERLDGLRRCRCRLPHAGHTPL